VKINIKAYIAWIAICIIWGTTYLAIRVGVSELPPMLFAGFRWIPAGIIMIILMNLRGHSLPKLKDMKHLAVVGIALIGIANGLVVVAEQWISSGLTALLLSTLPFWMVGFESLMPKGPKINYYIIGGLVVGLIGVVILFARDLEILVDMDLLIGALCLLGAVISWSLGSIYSKYVKVSVHPMMGASVQMLIAGILQAALGFILREQDSFQITQDGFLALGYLILLGSILGYASYIYAIEHLPLSLVSTYAYINPVIALILGWYFLNEELTIYIFISAVLILIGVVLVKRGNSLAAKKEQTT
jgi:drug/metabolite transporter (DMT)-like permease